jgi:hypothetical protein
MLSSKTKFICSNNLFSTRQFFTFSETVLDVSFLSGCLSNYVATIWRAINNALRLACELNEKGKFDETKEEISE